MPNSVILDHIFWNIYFQDYLSHRHKNIFSLLFVQAAKDCGYGIEIKITDWSITE